MFKLVRWHDNMSYFTWHQRELVRKIFILQEEGKISQDLSVSDFIEWLGLHGQDNVENDTDRWACSQVKKVLTIARCSIHKKTTRWIFMHLQAKTKEVTELQQ